jgi:hypothetical protein
MHQMADRLRQERLRQPLRSSVEAYAQMERMKKSQNGSSQNINAVPPSLV